MFDIARYSILKPINVWLFVLISCVGGVIGLKEIGRLEDPAFTIKQVQVVTQFPGASAEKVEKELTEQIEIALQKMPQLKELNSVSKPGVSVITVEVSSKLRGPQLPQVWDEVRKRIGDIENKLPLGAGQPVVYDDFGDVFGLYYALTAKDFTPYQIREFARILRRELLTLDGVAKVNVNGILEEHIVAELDRFQIAGLGLSYPDVANVINNHLRPAIGGRLLVGEKNLRLAVEASNNRLDEIADLSFVVPGQNRSIKLKDIATLSIKAVDIPKELIRYNGHPAVTLSVAAQKEVNIVAVGQAVNEKVAKVLAELPAGIEVDAIYDQAEEVDHAVDGFITNLEMSMLVVTLTLCLFMGWRSGVVVGVTLLVTVLGTVMIMWLYGLQLERISLGAMVIAMGMLVDNAIVVAEGMMLRMHAGKSALESASFIVKRTQWPLLGATIIGICAFSGIGLSDDTTGEFLFSLFAVVLISLLLSWVLAVTLTPLLGRYFYQVKDQSAHASTGFIGRQYLAFLGWALKWRWLTIAGLVLITVTAYASFGLIKQGFFPPSNSPIFFVHYWGPQDRDIRSTEKVMIKAEQMLTDLPQVKSVGTYIGKGAERFTLVYAPESANESYGVFVIRTHSSDTIETLSQTLPATLQQADPDGQFFSQVMQYGAPTKSKIEARISGDDPAQLRVIANQIKDIFYQDATIRDVRDNWREKGFVLTPKYDDIAAGLAGVSRLDFSEAIQYETKGLRVGQLHDGDYLYPIIVRNKGAENNDVIDIQKSLVWSSSQRKYIPFSQISSQLNYDSEEVLIHRRNRVRTITVGAEPGFNETAAKAFARSKAKIEQLVLPEGYYIEWGGEFESSQDAQKALGAGLPLGFLLMFIISVLLFGRARQPLIIWLLVPMALVGVVSGLLLADLPFGFMSLLGFLSLFGMLIKNAIVLLEEIDLQIQEGKAAHQAIVDASVSRLRPVSLAAITTILGISPLIFDPFFADMSVTIMGGLAFATVLTLIAVPVLYSVFYKVSFRAAQVTH
ncbi:efflux RND transporter permease subunit [Thalassotalea aquiviva]|uniref:efflux RND transporter permease subunit n=1 Tax=Thalassotalea aquiviva TaxID=3242415 RepID=UPI00352BBE5A